MNGDERQGDANPISDREKKNSSRGPRVQSRVHILFPSPPLSLPERGEPCARKKRKGGERSLQRPNPMGGERRSLQVQSERRLCSAMAPSTGPVRGGRRPPRRCNPPATTVERRKGVVDGHGEESPQRPVQRWISS